MVLNTVGKQWANIVEQFELSEKAQRGHNTEVARRGVEIDDYSYNRLRVFEIGLALAKEQHRSVRFKFWMKPHTSENMILVDFLLALEDFVTRKPDYHPQMTTALENWISWLNMIDEETRTVRERLLIPAFQ
jgi:hypothetical protein